MSFPERELFVGESIVRIPGKSPRTCTIPFLHKSCSRIGDWNCPDRTSTKTVQNEKTLALQFGEPAQAGPRSQSTESVGKRGSGWERGFTAQLYNIRFFSEPESARNLPEIEGELVPIRKIHLTLPVSRPTSGCLEFDRLVFGNLPRPSDCLWNSIDWPFALANIAGWRIWLIPSDDAVRAGPKLFGMGALFVL